MPSIYPASSPQCFFRRTGRKPMLRNLIDQTLVILFNLVFGFERFFTPSRQVRSDNWLPRITGKASPYSEALKKYKNGRLSKQQLADALLHIAVIGDSLTSDFHASPPLHALWQARTTGQRNWFLDTCDDRRPKIGSIFERIDDVFPLVATQLSRPGARVNVQNQRDLVSILAKIEHFSHQVDRFLRLRRCPELLCIWIGHNNCDWVEDVTDPSTTGSADLQILADRFENNFATQIGRLVDHLNKQHQRSAILVFGVVNFRTFFIAREKAEELHRQDPKSYWFLERDYDQYESLKPEYRGKVIEIADMLNTAMARVVNAQTSRISSPDTVRISYSDSLSHCDLSDVRTISKIDAWHPSAAGHRSFAESAIKDVFESLAFLRFDVNSQQANQQQSD